MYNEEYLQELINNKIEEDLNLDTKLLGLWKEPIEK